MSKYFTGVGRRKTAVAQTRIEEAKTSALMVNGENIDIFNELDAVLNLINANFKISVIIRGGGINSRKDAICMGVARALTKYDQEYKSVLRKNGFLTRDAREKERKKPGLRGARRAPQWAKR